MDLVKREIDRLNESIGKSGSVTMIFQRGNIRVRLVSMREGHVYGGIIAAEFCRHYHKVFFVASGSCAQSVPCQHDRDTLRETSPSWHTPV